MKHVLLRQLVAASLVATLALAGCKKKDEAAVPVDPAPPVLTPSTPPTSTTAPAANVSVNSVDLGNAIGDDMRVPSPSVSFARTDTIHASVSTTTSDPMASVAGSLGARWSYQDGQVVNEERQDVMFNGDGATVFQVSKPDGWPAGSYKLEISLNGNVVQTRDFTIQ